MTTRPTPPQHGITQDIPLPGNYGVLTLQLNVTRYHPAGTIRWTAILREPVNGLEIQREIQEVADETDALDAKLLGVLEQMMTNMLWLQTGRNR